MKRTLLYVSFTVAAIFSAAPCEARKKKDKDKPVDAAAEIKIIDKPEPPPAPIMASEPIAPAVAAELALQPVAPPPPQMVVVGRRPFWEVAAAGGGVIGGAFVLSALVGAFSYAGFYDGQWGWFIPVAGPALAMAGVGGEPAGCLSKAAYTYSLGPILTLIYVGGIATAITGAFVKKDITRPAASVSGAPPGASAPAAPPALQFTPTVGPNGAGMLILGTF
mgnify:CR=1 FL=1